LEHLLPAVPIPAAPISALALPASSGGGRERVLRVLYLGRLSLATGIFVAAIAVWRRADTSATLVATLAFISTRSSLRVDLTQRREACSRHVLYLQVISTCSR
jgi:hypothetical protein